MTDAVRNKALAQQARRVFLEALMRGMVPLTSGLNNHTAQLLLAPAEYPIMVARRDAVQSWNRRGQVWQSNFLQALRQGFLHGVPEPSRGDVPSGQMTLVDDVTIERQIACSRLSLAMMDRATWEFTDLRTRMQMLERRDDLDARDLLRSQTIAELVLDAWHRAGLDGSVWNMLQAELHEEFASLVGEAYHEVNRWLIAQQVMPEVDLRPFIRRSPQAAHAAAQQVVAAIPGALVPNLPVGGGAAVAPGMRVGAGLGNAGAERLVPSQQAEQVMALLQRVLDRHVPGYAAAHGHVGATPAGAAGAAGPAVRGGVGAGAALPAGPPGAGSAAGAAGAAGSGSAGDGAPTGVPASPRLSAAIRHAQDMLQRQAEHVVPATAPMALDEIRSRQQAFKQVLKQAADSPAERATIEIVAMMFQSILTEERLPASVRVWFARLQMPVLRVAVSEPDFFAVNDHPARQLIDRMGACVMGFSAGSASLHGDNEQPLEREIKRVVQVVEAYPDTGRRVFATVLTEFEKFLANYFEKENQATVKGVSLAQQVEQRETLAIQYTIELRKMLNEVPVQDGVRLFLFQVWADVLAVAAMREGGQSETTKTMKRAAADLIWSASAKVSRDERAEVIRRLPPLLKTLRDGMHQAGLSLEKQDQHVRELNNALAAAFTAKTAAIPRERLDELMEQLETLEAMLPEGEGSVQFSESLMRDLSGHESDDMEVVADGGMPPTAAMLAWARELPVGGWYKLDYRARTEVVQLAWRGMRHHLALFVTPGGRGVLFQLHRMAAFLQAGLLQPAQEEALTVKATRSALEKLEADPSRLLA